jgi:cysteine desulfurase
LIEEVMNIGGFRLNGPSDLQKRVCNNINISSKALEGELLLMELSKVGICVSTGSACSSKSTKVSPILQAIHCPVEYLHGNIRISLSKYTTKEEIDVFLHHLKRIVQEKKGFSLNPMR